MAKTESIKLQIFKVSIFFIYITYILTFLGISYIDSSKIRLFSIVVQFIISLILIVRFHPFNHHELTKFDRAIIFSSASFLFVNLLITEIYNYVGSSSNIASYNITNNIKFL
jgi:hypothetical protein